MTIAEGKLAAIQYMNFDEKGRDNRLKFNEIKTKLIYFENKLYRTICRQENVTHFRSHYI